MARLLSGDARAEPAGGRAHATGPRPELRHRAEHEELRRAVAARRAVARTRAAAEPSTAGRPATEPQHPRAERQGLFRLVGRLGCTAGVAGAPDDPRLELENIDSQAHDMAAELAADFNQDVSTVRADGIPASPSDSFNAYLHRFGLPVAQGRGFLNRITGIVRPTQEIATAEELRILARRFELVARLLSGNIHYKCGDPVDLGGGCAGSCGDFSAFSCRGTSGIAICPPFWSDRFDDDTARAALIIHESMHIILASSSNREVGAVDDDVLRGPGRNFDVAACYQGLVGDVFFIDTDRTDTCPPIP